MNAKDKANLINAAHAGGAVLRKYFGKALNPIEKSSIWDLQTKADLDSEKVILKILKEKFPAYNIFSEETGKIDKDSDYTIVVDPLDGTNNFTLGIPVFCVSIAIMRGNEAIAGVLYQPITDQTYYAEKGKGAFLNNKKITVSNVTDPKRINISYQCGYLTDRRYIARLMKNLIEAPHKRILRNWCPTESLYLLASGKTESLISDSLELYDFAAGKLIAHEAGAKIIDFNGKKEKEYTNNRFIISNSEKVNKFVLKTIKANSRP